MDENILSKRDKPKFSHDGYLYVFDKFSKTDPTLLFWRCELKNECKGRIHTRNSEVVNEVNEHSHSASAADVVVASIKTRLKRKAEETLEVPSIIINECIGDCSQAVQGSLPNTQALKKIIRRKRNALQSAPPNPANSRDLVIPDYYKSYVTNNGQSENFLLCDSGQEDGRILIFGRQSWLVFLRESDVWYADGTFKMSPPLFYQVYVIMAKRHGGVFPVFYALLPNKRRITYIRMFRMIKDLLPDLQPKGISCDYEHAAFSAMEECFPGVELKGCFFHLAHNIYKQLKHLGLQRLFNNDPEFALKAKMIVALCFVPVSHMDDYIDALSRELPDELQPLFHWFEDNYAGRPIRRGNGRRPPIFPIEMWNQYRRTIAGEDRTNNYAEAAHRKVYAELGINHPVIWKFIDGIRKIQKGYDTYYEQLIAGKAPNQKIQKYIKADERILNITKHFNSRAPLEYLRDQRIEEVTYWELELNTKLEELSNETELLLAQKTRLEKALDSCSAPLCITQQCLLNREKRVGIDLVHDEVERELLKEAEVLQGVIALLRRTADQTEEQLRLNRMAKFYLEKDLQDKATALKVDKFTANLTNNSPNIDYWSNVVRTEGNSVTPEEWQDFTNSNIVNADKQKNNSAGMRALVDSILSETTSDMLKQVETGNRAFRYRIQETKDAKSKLEKQLSKVMDEIFSQEKNIELLRKTIMDKEGPLKVAQTRLETRTKRPNVELVRDPAQHRLVSEVQEITGNVERLRVTLAQAEAELRGLRRNQLALEEEIEVKSNSLYIDDVQCTNLRNSISINYF